MKAYKCDICGKFYSSVEGFQEKTNPVTGNSIGFVPTGIQFTGDEGRERTFNHDVCQDCMYYFRKIIKEIKDNGGVKDI